MSGEETVPTIVIVYRPAGTVAPTVTVAVLEPVSGFVPNATVTPAGSPKYVNSALDVPFKFVRLMSVVPVPL
jgi:hypothetical protein